MATKTNKRATKSHVTDNYVYMDTVSVDEKVSTKLEVKLQLHHEKGRVKLTAILNTENISLRSDDINEAVNTNLGMLIAQAQADAKAFLIQWGKDNPPEDDGQMAISG